MNISMQTGNSTFPPENQKALAIDSKLTFKMFEFCQFPFLIVYFF